MTTDLRHKVIATSARLDASGLRINYTLEGRARTLKLAPWDALKIMVDLRAVADRLETEDGLMWVLDDGAINHDLSPAWCEWTDWAHRAEIGLLWAKEIVLRWMEDEEFKFAYWAHVSKSRKPEWN